MKIGSTTIHAVGEVTDEMTKKYDIDTLQDRVTNELHGKIMGEVVKNCTFNIENNPNDGGCKVHCSVAIVDVDQLFYYNHMMKKASKIMQEYVESRPSGGFSDKMREWIEDCKNLFEERE